MSAPSEPLDSAQAAECRPLALVMDDDPLFRSLIISMLKREYEVVAAADGSDGFYTALKRPPDVAVVDIQMPVWNGIRTLQAFRENASLHRVGLLVLTSDASKGTVLAAIAAGADDYVIKTNLSREELLQKLHRIRTRPRSPVSSGAHAMSSHREPHRGGLRFPVADALEGGDAMATETDRRLQELIDAWE